MKKSGPALKLDLPKNLVPCEACGGRGHTMGLLHEIPCVPCNGFGRIDGDTGQAVPEHRLIPALVKALNHVRAQNRHLVNQYSRDADDSQPDPYKGSGRYKGD